MEKEGACVNAVNKVVAEVFGDSDVGILSEVADDLCGVSAATARTRQRHTVKILISLFILFPFFRVRIFMRNRFCKANVYILS